MPQTLSKLFAPSCGWKLETLPDDYNKLSSRCTDTDGIYQKLNQTSYSTLHRDITKAVLMYTGFTGVHNAVEYSKFAVTRVSNTKFAAERGLYDGKHEVVTYDTNGNIEAAVISTTGRYSSFKGLTQKSDADITTICLALLPAIAETDSDIEALLNKNYTELTTNNLYFLSDAVYRKVNYDDSFVATIPSDGNIDKLAKSAVSAGTYNGTVIRGAVNILAGNSGVTRSQTSTLTMKDAKIEFAAFANSRTWTDEEKMFIPQFDDDFIVPKEALKIARKFVNTSSDRNPMRNFLWRGVTSYGKSTGVAAIACMLNIPLLKVTCNTNMETQAFLADYVPDTSNNVNSGDFPDFESIKFDPEGAYYQLTGIEDANATPDMCLKAYGEAFAKRNSSTPRYKFVESNYVKALTNGYIVEIQECSRIKDSGVLVGLNEYDRPGAVIPLIDGSYKRRDANAMVIYTDNIGYVSCRPMDPSVIRRNAFAINSYELTKDMVISRVKYNTKMSDKIIEACYSAWSDIKTYCEDHDITEGELSATELEMCVQAIKCDGEFSARGNIIDCIISKITSDKDEYMALITVVDTNWGKYGF